MTLELVQEERQHLGTQAPVHNHVAQAHTQTSACAMHARPQRRPLASASKSISRRRGSASWQQPRCRNKCRRHMRCEVVKHLGCQPAASNCWSEGAMHRLVRLSPVCAGDDPPRSKPRSTRRQTTPRLSGPVRCPRMGTRVVRIGTCCRAPTGEMQLFRPQGTSNARTTVRCRTSRKCSRCAATCPQDAGSDTEARLNPRKGQNEHVLVGGRNGACRAPLTRALHATERSPASPSRS